MAESSTTCTTCEHCDTREAGGAVLRKAGYCTYAYAFFAHKAVPVWLTGCPDYKPVEVTQ